MDWKTAHRSMYYDGAPLPDDPVIDPARTAFLVIDVQNVYVERPDRDMLSMEERRRYDAWTPFHERLTGQLIPRTTDMLTICRARGIECLFARIACHKDDGRDRSLSQKLPGWNNILLPRTEHASQIVPELQPQGDEIVVTKTTASALTGTKLRLMLRNMDVRTVVCAGIFTDQCVSSTVRSLADESFSVIVLEDCCAAGSDALHDRELEIINMIYCHVMRAQDFVSLLPR